jgi:hypothetical protein
LFKSEKLLEQALRGSSGLTFGGSRSASVNFPFRDFAEQSGSPDIPFHRFLNQSLSNHFSLRQPGAFVNFVEFVTARSAKRGGF